MPRASTSRPRILQASVAALSLAAVAVGAGMAQSAPRLPPAQWPVIADMPGPEPRVSLTGDPAAVEAAAEVEALALEVIGSPRKTWDWPERTTMFAQVVPEWSAVVDSRVSSGADGFVVDAVARLAQFGFMEHAERVRAAAQFTPLQNDASAEANLVYAYYNTGPGVLVDETSRIFTRRNATGSAFFSLVSTTARSAGEADVRLIMNRLLGSGEFPTILVNGMVSSAFLYTGRTTAAADLVRSGGELSQCGFISKNGPAVANQLALQGRWQDAANLIGQMDGSCLNKALAEPGIWAFRAAGHGDLLRAAVDQVIARDTAIRTLIWSPSFRRSFGEGTERSHRLRAGLSMALIEYGWLDLADEIIRARQASIRAAKDRPPAPGREVDELWSVLETSSMAGAWFASGNTDAARRMRSYLDDMDEAEGWEAYGMLGALQVRPEAGSIERTARWLELDEGETSSSVVMAVNLIQLDRLLEDPALTAELAGFLVQAEIPRRRITTFGFESGSSETDALKLLMLAGDHRSAVAGAIRHGRSGSVVLAGLASIAVFENREPAVRHLLETVASLAPDAPPAGAFEDGEWSRLPRVEAGQVILDGLCLVPALAAIRESFRAQALAMLQSGALADDPMIDVCRTYASVALGSRGMVIEARVLARTITEPRLRLLALTQALRPVGLTPLEAWYTGLPLQYQ